MSSDDPIGERIADMNKVRIPPLPLERWQAGLLDKVNGLSYGKLQAEKNVYRTLANHPRLFVAWMQLGVYLLQRSSLDGREREMVILRTTALAGGRYPYTQHVAIGQRCGLGKRDISAILDGPSSPHWQVADRRLLSAVDELMAGCAMNDATWKDLQSGFGTPECMDIATTVAFYRLAAWLLNACRTPLEAMQERIDMTAKDSKVRFEANAYRGAPRISPLTPEDWPPELLADTARWPGLRTRPELRRAGVYTTLANHPALFQAIGGLAVHILNRSSLQDRARELVIIRACACARGAYPYRQHIGIGRSVGLTEAEIAAVSQARPRGLGEREQIMMELVDALFRKNDVDDRVWALARAGLSIGQLMDAIVICGFYGLVSTVLNVARTPLEPGGDNLPQHFVE